jgi:ATP-dependent Zn protease
VHVRGVSLAHDVDLGALAATTVGVDRANLANIVNEAWQLAARRWHERVQMSATAGPPRRPVVFVNPASGG